MARASEATKQLEKAILATAADHPEVGGCASSDSVKSETAVGRCDYQCSVLQTFTD